jgi:hypothetical protein
MHNFACSIIVKGFFKPAMLDKDLNTPDDVQRYLGSQLR